MTTRNLTSLTIGLALCGTAASQATVPFTSPTWKDFGTSNIVGVSGNFMPGWTSLTGTPDIGNNLFGIPTTSLSGASNDAGLWMNGTDLTSPTGGSNESVRLSLSGFSIGQTYQLDFFATLTQVTSAGWVGNNDTMDVALAGAGIATFNTSVLTDAIDSDGLNTWTAQSIVFTALSPTVTFDFGSNPMVDPSGAATRYGIDGIDMRLVPAPSAVGAFSIVGAAALRRRRRVTG